jgi:hypothetical protein
MPLEIHNYSCSSTLISGISETIEFDISPHPVDFHCLPWLTNCLPDLCSRRSWADPTFETRRSRQGWTCLVRVNNREYTADTTYPTENMAREKAAESAYFICYNFSVNDGMYPGQRQGQAGVTQGLPVAIGTGRHSNRYNNAEYTVVSAYGDALSRESSPRTSDSDLEHSTSRRSSASSSGSPPVCMCNRGYVSRHSRCGHCLREAGWY